MINVIGLGYIGLPTALMLASNGNTVVGTDKNKRTVRQLLHGQTTFEEYGLEQLYARAMESGISFCTAPVVADVYIVAVATPFDKLSKKVDSSNLVTAVKDILQVAESGATIVIESTIPPNTIDVYIRPILDKSKKVMHLAHAPERIIPGNMIFELEQNSRVIGVDDIATGEKVKNIYSSFCKGIIEMTDIRTAEMSKVVENTYRDVNIAFANELAKICRQSELDVYEIIRIANMHPRVNILSPGPGVGGHCISVDPWFLVGDYPHLSLLIHEARKVNDSMPEYVLNRIYQIMEENRGTDTLRVGLYGLTYKENVDDIRESPTMQLLQCMGEEFAREVKVYDPFVNDTVAINQYFSLEEFLDNTDLIIVMVGHDEIKQNSCLVEGKIILDTRNCIPKTNPYRL